jgi:hypothetical protein
MLFQLKTETTIITNILSWSTSPILLFGKFSVSRVLCFSCSLSLMFSVSHVLCLSRSLSLLFIFSCSLSCVLSLSGSLESNKLNILFYIQGACAQPVLRMKCSFQWIVFDVVKISGTGFV